MLGDEQAAWFQRRLRMLSAQPEVTDILLVSSVALGYHPALGAQLVEAVEHERYPSHTSMLTDTAEILIQSL